MAPHIHRHPPITTQPSSQPTYTTTTTHLHPLTPPSPPIYSSLSSSRFSCCFPSSLPFNPRLYSSCLYNSLPSSSRPSHNPIPYLLHFCTPQPCRTYSSPFFPTPYPLPSPREPPSGPGRTREPALTALTLRREPALTALTLQSIN